MIGVAAVKFAMSLMTSTTTSVMLVKGSRAFTMSFVSFDVGMAASMGLMKKARPSQVTGPT